MTKTLSFTKFRESANYVLDLMNQGIEVKIVFGKGKKAKTVVLAEDQKLKQPNFFESLKQSEFYKNYKCPEELKNKPYKELIAEMYKDKYGI